MKTKIFASWMLSLSLAGCTHQKSAPISHSVGIVNGSVVSKKEELALSVVALISETDEGQALCTGTILNSETILTAAHCVEHPMQMVVVFASRVSAAKGENIRAVDGYVPHPDWPGSEAAADLALVHFTGGLPAGFKPVALGVSVQPSLREPILLVGYGVTDGIKRKGSGVLRETDSTILRLGPQGEIFSDGRDSSVCFGDSGGPLFVERGGEWQQIAVAHSVADNACTTASVHASLATAAAWIARTMARLSDHN
jgi:secreted trypsin-like serine protease